MLKVASYDIVFQEIPGEVTLALNLSGCPCHCPGCHSQHLWEDTGEELTRGLLDNLMNRYSGLVTCVCFMGGDQAPEEVHRLAEHAKQSPVTTNPSPIKTAWYSGRTNMPEADGVLDYVKLGPYIESLGGLKSPTTNQRLYQLTANQWNDITSTFWKKRFWA